jgi:tape measure domain-containing protein
MTETHEIRLKIDAGAAQEGSRQFSAAVNSVKAAVRGLERDSSGAFTKINKSMKELGALGKLKVAGVDARSIQNLESFALAQANVVKTTTAASKGITSLVRLIGLLADGYASGRKNSNLFTASIISTNNALARQIVLAQQARAALSQSGRVAATPNVKATGPASVGSAGIPELTRLIVGLSAAYTRLGSASVAAGNAGKTGMDEAAKAARTAAAAQAKQESIQLSVSAAMRRAEIDTARLSDKLSTLGDTAGINRLHTALGTLRAALAGDVTSVAQLRSAIETFNSTTTQMKTGIIAVEGAQRRATSASRDQAKQQQAVASTARQVEQEMRSVAGAANAADAAFRKATGGMRGLENAFSTTFQIGTLFRNLLGSLTLGTLTRSIFEAGNSLDQFGVTMKVATGSFAGAQAEMAFLDNMTRTLGTDLTAARDSYSKFAISSSLAGVAAKDTQEIFSSVSMALSVLGKGTEDQNLAFLALEQMMSKGTMSSEELRRQLGERLPGAVNLMAKALGVTTLELNKMLKAGSIQSADALPKFAAEIRKEFGPGLVDATKRAGFALGTVRGEMTRLMETTANAGFMQVLAAEFSKLTTTLQSPEVYDAARKLGDGFAVGAEMAGDALLFLATHINEIGTAVKDVVNGLIIRQLALGGAAFVAFAQRGVVAVASVTDFLTGQTVGASAADRHTIAIQNNTRAMLANAAASAGGATSVAGLAAAQSGAALTGPIGNVTRAGGAVGGLGRAAAGAGAVLGGLTRILGFLGPAALAASIAFSVLPMMFSDTKKDADRFADGLAEALRRSGASFDEFKNTVATTTSAINFNNILNDLTTFNSATSLFITEQSDKFAGLQAIINGVSAKGIDTSGWSNTKDELGLEALGIQKESIDSLLPSSRQAVGGLMEITQEAIKANGSVLQVRDAMRDLMIMDPNTKNVLGPVYDSIEGMALAEVSRGAEKDKMVNLFGSSDDKLTKDFVDMAKQVVGTGEGMDALRAKTLEVAKTNSNLAKTFKDIELAAEKATLSGGKISPWEFKRSQEHTYDSKAVEVEAATKAQTVAQGHLNVMREKYSQILRENASDLKTQISVATDDLRTQRDTANKNGETYQGPAINTDAAKIVDEATQSYARFKDEILSVQEVTNSLSLTNASIAPYQTATSQANTKALTDEIVRQYRALDTSKQTYLGLQSVMARVVTGPAFSAMKNYTDQISSAVRSSKGLEMSGRDLEKQLTAVGATTGSLGVKVQEVSQQLVNAAQNTDTLQGAAAGAVSTLGGLVSKLFAMANAAAQAANLIATARAAFGGMFAAAADYHTGTTEYVTNAKREAELKAMLPDVAAFQRKADTLRAEAKAVVDGINKEYEQVKPLVLAGNPAANGAQATRDSRIASVQSDLAERLKAEKIIADTVTPSASKGGSGGGSGAADVEKYNDKLSDKIALLNGENDVLQKLGTSYFDTADAATMYAKALAAGGQPAADAAESMIRQYDAAKKLNDELTRLAKDPLKDWLDAVPMWSEGARTIEAGAISSLSDALSNFYQTGKFDALSFVQSIRKTFADILSQQTIKTFMNMMNYKGSKIQPMQLGGGETAAAGAAAGQSIGTALLSAGQQVAAMFRSALGVGGRQAGTSVRVGTAAGGAAAAGSMKAASIAGANTLHRGVSSGARSSAPVLAGGVERGAARGAIVLAKASSGGKGGGFGSSLLQFGLGLFGLSEGGYSDRPSLHPMSASPAAFRNAPHFKEGGVTSGGIPAILHPNEAVIPLSRGRKIPIEMPNGQTEKSGSLTSVTFGDINVQVEMQGGADNSAEAAKAAGRIAELIKASVAEQMATAMVYGGQLNPRGR